MCIKCSRRINSLFQHLRSWPCPPGTAPRASGSPRPRPGTPRASSTPRGTPRPTEVKLEQFGGKLENFGTFYGKLSSFFAHFIKQSYSFFRHLLSNGALQQLQAVLRLRHRQPAQDTLLQVSIKTTLNKNVIYYLIRGVIK